MKPAVVQLIVAGAIGVTAAIWLSLSLTITPEKSNQEIAEMGIRYWLTEVEYEIRDAHASSAKSTGNLIDNILNKYDVPEMFKLDPWNNSYSASFDSTSNLLHISSCGPDGISGTADDLSISKSLE